MGPPPRGAISGSGASDLGAFFPGELRTKTRDFVKFTTVDGAQYHDAPIGSQWHGEVAMNWLDQQFFS